MFRLFGRQTKQDLIDHNYEQAMQIIELKRKLGIVEFDSCNKSRQLVQKGYEIEALQKQIEELKAQVKELTLDEATSKLIRNNIHKMVAVFERMEQEQKMPKSIQDMVDKIAENINADE